MRLAFILELRKKDKSTTPHVDKSSVQQKPIQEAFANEVSNMLKLSNPDELASDELSDKIRSVPDAAAQNFLHVITKDKFSSEFSTDTIRLIYNKNVHFSCFCKNPVSELHVHCERPTENYAETLNRQYLQIVLHCSRKQNSWQLRLNRTGLRAINY